MMEENHEGSKLINGVRSDIETLIKNFKEGKSVRFADFSQFWTNSNFSLIFCERTNVAEILEFIQEILQITKDYLSPVNEFQTRIGALYALYGLYFKQPLQGAAKIRLVKSEWFDLTELIEKCKREKHFDVVFVHLKLFINEAYLFTASTRDCGLERGFRKYHNKKIISCYDSKDVQLKEKPLIRLDLVEIFSELEQLYCNKKSELLGNKDLLFIEKEFGRKLKEKVDKFIKRRENLKNVQLNARLEDAVADADGFSHSSIGSRRTELKSKALKFVQER